jgi:hypothetical protein
MERNLDRVIRLLMLAAKKDPKGTHTMCHYHNLARFLQELSCLSRFACERIRFFKLADIFFKEDRGGSEK